MTLNPLPLNAAVMCRLMCPAPFYNDNPRTAIPSRSTIRAYERSAAQTLSCVYCCENNPTDPVQSGVLHMRTGSLFKAVVPAQQYHLSGRPLRIYFLR